MNHELNTILDKLREREFPSESEILKREQIAERMQLENRRAVYWDTYMKHLPARYKDAPKTRPEQLPARLIEPKLGQSLFIHGPRGTGKTHLAIWTAGQLVRLHGVAARFTTWVAMLEAFRNFESTERRPAPMAYAVLIVDDCDKGAATPYASERFSEVCDRLNDNATRTTIFTSNRPPAQTAKLFYQGDTHNQAALASRLAYWCDPIFIGGKDRRGESHETI